MTRLRLKDQQPLNPLLPDGHPGEIQIPIFQLCRRAEMLRLAAIAITAKGIRVCCPVHDAFLVEAPVSEIDEVVESVQLSMAEASAVILGGPQIRTDVDIFKYPNRYVEGDGTAMWELVTGLADLLDQEADKPLTQPGLSAK